MSGVRHKSLMIMVSFAGLLLGSGCHSLSRKQPIPIFELPRESQKIPMAEYRLEAPDVVNIDLIAAVPKPPYRIKPMDGIAVRVPDSLPENPIGGVYQIEPDGTINFGSPYGSVKVSGLTMEEAKVVVEKHLKKVLKTPIAEIALAQGRAMQLVRGPHLIRQDGTIGLGNYGSVLVTGKSINEAKLAIEAHLSQYFEAPEVSLDVTGYNSKVYYVIMDGGGNGQQIVRAPVTGNETVLDAIGQIGGLQTISDSKKIWIARPRENCSCEVFPVDWVAITECGDTRTNYQLIPGDRVYVKAYPMITFYNTLNRVFYPIERILGVTLLGQGLRREFQQNNNGNGF